MNSHSNSAGDQSASLSADMDRTLDRAHDLLTEALDIEPSHGESPRVSFVIPVKDEQDTLETLANGIRANVPASMDYEIIFVDDGSDDDSWQVIRSLCQRWPAHVRGIRFRHNAGKATSLMAGFRASRGQIVFTMDADLQDDPQEIPRFLAKLDEGFDLVSGWKKVRHDPWHKVLPSRVFNVFASFVGGVWLHDHNCGFKCYRREVIMTISLHGELHRVVPSLANMQGFQCAEIVVSHHPRRSGQSKYGLERILRGLCDVATTGFLRRFRERPAHFFNGIAGVQAVFASGLLATGLYQWTQQQPAQLALLTGIVLGTLAITSLFLGLLAELVIRGPLRTRHELPVSIDTGISRHVPATVEHQERRSSPGVIPPVTAPATTSATFQL